MAEMIHQRHNFTLVEILVVAAITGVLITLALPAFNKLVTGDKVTRAAQIISTVLGQARSEAVVGRRYVAAVFPYPGQPNLVGGTAGQKCAAVSLTRNDTGEYAVDASRAADVQWRSLPSGTALIAVHNNTPPSINGAWYETCRTLEPNHWEFTVLSTTTASFSSALFPDAVSTGSQPMRCVIFGPDGGVVTTGGPWYFVVSEGAVLNNSFEPTYPAASNPTGNAPNNCFAVKLNRFSGTASYYELRP